MAISGKITKNFANAKQTTHVVWRRLPLGFKLKMITKLIIHSRTFDFNVGLNGHLWRHNAKQITNGFKSKMITKLIIRLHTFEFNAGLNGYIRRFEC